MNLYVMPATRLRAAFAGIVCLVLAAPFGACNRTDAQPAADPPRPAADPRAAPRRVDVTDSSKTRAATSIRLDAAGPRRVLLISIDTLRPDHLGAYGYHRPTAPNLDRLAAESVIYEQAYANGAWTMPSHMSLLTGTLPSRHGLDDAFDAYDARRMRAPGPSIKPVPELLQQAGIQTLKFADLPSELGFSRGFATDAPVDPIVRPWFSQTLVRTLSGLGEQPWFAFVHTWMVHAPYASTYFLPPGALPQDDRDFLDDYRRLALVTNAKAERYWRFLQDRRLYNRDACVDLYDGGIRKTDRYLGELFDALRASGLYDDLMVIVVSDHGEHFSEHHEEFFDYHGRDQYEEFVRVPLMIKYPRAMREPHETRISTPVSLIDVAPTILRFFGVEVPELVQGQSLLDARPTPRDIVSEALSVHPEVKLLRTGHHKLMLTMHGADAPGRVNWQGVTKRRLFDLEADPGERVNLCGEPGGAALCDVHQATLRTIVTESVRGRSASTVKLLPSTLEQIQALGYVD